MTRLHVASDGSGEPLLCIPGFGVSSRMYEPLVKRYRERFEIVRYDPLGSGRSSWWIASPSVPMMAAEAVRALDTLGLDSAHMMGLSLGGLVAQEVALRFPHRVRGLILGSTATSGPLATPPNLVNLARVAGRSLGDSVRQRRLAVGASLYEVADFAEGPALDRALPWTLFAHLLAFTTHDRERSLQHVEAPTLILHGERDALVSPANARRLARRIPRAELQLVPGAGHGLVLERRDAVYRLISDWLDRVGPITPPPAPGGAAARREQLARLGGLPLGTLRVQRNALALTMTQRARLRRPLTTVGTSATGRGRLRHP